LELLLDVEADLAEVDLVEADLVEVDLPEDDLPEADLVDVDAVLFPSAAVLTIEAWLDEAEVDFALPDFDVDLVDFFASALLFFFTVDLFFSIDWGAAQTDAARPRVTLSTAAVSAIGARKGLV